MSKKDDKILSELKSISEITKVDCTKNNEYYLIYTPKKLKGAYSGSTFRIKMILSKQFPDTSPQIYFVDIPYHLNIDRKNGRLNAAFLSQDWCSFINIQMIFQEIKSLLEKPEEKSPACQKIKKQYFENRKAYEEKVSSYNRSKDVPQSVIRPNSPEIPSPVPKNVKFSLRQQKQGQSVISISDTIKDFQKNDVFQSVLNSREQIDKSPTVRRKGSSPLVISDSLGIKKIGGISQKNLLKACSMNRNQSQFFLPEYSKQVEKLSKINQSKLQIHHGLRQQSRSPPNLSSNIQGISYEEQEQLESRETNVFRSQQSRSQKSKQNSLTKSSKMLIKGSVPTIQRKQTNDVRKLFKEKRKSDTSSVQSPDSSENINMNIKQSVSSNESLKNKKSQERFSINLYPLNDNKTQKKLDQEKTARRPPELKLQNSLRQQPMKNIVSLSQSLKTIRLKEKISQNESSNCVEDLQKLSLDKVLFHIEASMNECQYIQKMLVRTDNDTLKYVLEKKLQKQAEFISKLQNMAINLKRCIVKNLASEVNKIL